MRIAFCGAMKSPNISTETLTTDIGKTMVGGNTGNFVIGDYGRRTIKYDECMECSFPWGIPMPAEEFNEKFDHLVIFAANWLAHYMKGDFTESANWLEKITVPVTLIGLGAQYDIHNLNKAEYVKTLNPSLIRLFQVIASKTKSISTRGFITEELLHEIGIKNVNVTGCPTWYVNGAQQQTIQKKPFSEDFKIAMHADTSNLNAYSRLYDLAENIKDKTYIFQSEFDTIPVINGDMSKKDEIITKYRFAPEVFDNENWGKIFGSLSEWENFIKTRDLVMGMRIHGTIIAIKNHVPAILFYHDGRTFEFVDVLGLPRWTINDLFDETKSLEYFYNHTDFDNMNKKYRFLLSNYKLFLQENGLEFNE